MTANKLFIDQAIIDLEEVLVMDQPAHDGDSDTWYIQVEFKNGRVREYVWNFFDDAQEVWERTQEALKDAD